MIIGVLKEPAHENRVSLLPDAVSQLIKKGLTVQVERGAGEAAGAPDQDYEKAGATIHEKNQIIQQARVVLCIHLAPGNYNKDQVLIGIYQPLINFKAVHQLAVSGATIFSLDMLPRTTRAQSMDVLSSQANIAGYKSVLLAANNYVRYLPMFMTAAGSIAPARVLVLGAGVAGLQAVATARRLGAVVEVFDTRPAVKEEVMSLGAKFVEVEGAADASTAGGYAVEQSEEYKQKQQARIAEVIARADIVITTAQIPGRKAPILVTEQMVHSMRRGSVIIDIAAATGGNTPFTKDQETVSVNGVLIMGQGNLPSTMPFDASKLYGKNVMNFLQLLLTPQAGIHLNWDDDLVKGACILHEGELVNQKVKDLINT